MNSTLWRFLKAADGVADEAAAKAGATLREVRSFEVDPDIFQQSGRTIAPRGLREARRRLQEIERRDHVFDRMRNILDEIVPGLFDYRRALAGEALRKQGLDEIWLQFSDADWGYLFGRAIAVRESDKRIRDGLIRNFGGDVREIMSKHLPEIEREVKDTVEEIEDACLELPSILMPMDTAIHKSVRIPTIGGGPSAFGLGTDRLLGVASQLPEIIETRSGIQRIVGRFTPITAVEIKGRTTVADGVKQHMTLPERMAKGGEMNLDGVIWRMDYEPKAVRHIVVAPHGGAHGSAQRQIEAMLKEGIRIELITFSARLDDQVEPMAARLLHAAEKCLGR